MKIANTSCPTPLGCLETPHAWQRRVASTLAGGLLALVGCADSEAPFGNPGVGGETNGTPQVTTSTAPTTGSAETTGTTATVGTTGSTTNTSGMIATTNGTPGVTTGVTTTGTSMPPADGGMLDGNVEPDAEAPMMGTGMCCDDGNCLCHGPDPSGLTAMDGSYKVEEFKASTGTVFYPGDAQPPFAAIALCGGFLNTGPEMNGWGTFYASHGIVTLITATGGADLPDLRGSKLLASIEELKSANADSGSPLFEKLSGRYGTSGYSMGGGGTTIASGDKPDLLTSVGLAAWAPEGGGVQVPTLLLCGTADTTAPCGGSGGSVGAYGDIPESTPKMLIEINGASHLASWFGPRDGGGGISGSFALAFQKVFLEGDERWRPLLQMSPSDGSKKTTNIN